MNLLLAAAMAAALSCPAPQEAPLPTDVAPTAQAEAAAAAPPAPQQPERTVCTYETVEGSNVPERICRTVLNLRLVRLPTAEAPAPAPAQETPTVTAAAPSAER